MGFTIEHNVEMPKANTRYNEYVGTIYGFLKSKDRTMLMRFDSREEARKADLSIRGIKKRDGLEFKQAVRGNLLYISK